MPEKDTYIFGIELLVPDPEETMQWLCDYLFFHREQWNGTLLAVNGNMRLILNKSEAPMPTPASEDLAGLQHFALETHDICTAAAYCKNKGLTLELDDDSGAFYNPKVYGTGMNYFNILTDFGFKVEVSQKLHRSVEPGENLICGLEHIGLLVPKIEEALVFYEALGFRKEFQVVENYNGQHTILCCMASARDTTLELYEFKDITDMPPHIAPVMHALWIAGESLARADTQPFHRGPAGEKIVMIEASSAPQFRSAPKSS